MQEQSELKRRIQEEMTVSYSINLEKSFDLAKRFIRLVPDGTVELLLKDNLTRKQQILLYLIGKMYAKEAGYVTDESASNNELLKHVGLPLGSLLPFLKELRDQNLIHQIKRDNNVHHSFPLSKLPEILNTIDGNLNGNQDRLLDSAVRYPRGKGETSLVLQRLQDRLIPEGYFEQPRTTHEVRSQLESKFQIKFLSRKVSQALGKLHARGILSRVGSKGDFRYIAATAKLGTQQNEN
jgi:hypothetical protein